MQAFCNNKLTFDYQYSAANVFLSVLKLTCKLTKQLFKEIKCKVFIFGHCTNQTLIKITMKISVGFTALSLPLWHSITVGVFL